MCCLNIFLLNPYTPKLLKWTIFESDQNRMANSVVPDVMAHYESSHQDVHSLQKFVSVCRAERVKITKTSPSLFTKYGITLSSGINIWAQLFKVNDVVSKRFIKIYFE